MDLCVVLGAYLGPLVVRFDGAVPARYWQNFLRFAPIAVITHLAVNYMLGLYGRMWRYASVEEARRVLAAGGVGGVATFVGGGWLLNGYRVLPLWAVALGSILALVGFGAVRFQSRLFGLRRREALATPGRALVYGAGNAGADLIKDILRNPGLGLAPVGIVDDDRRKLGRALSGVPIIGTGAMLPALIRELKIDQVLLAIPSAEGSLVEHVAAVCEEAEVTLRVLPSVREIVGGRVSARDIRDLRIEDLLGRRQVNTDLEAVAGLLKGRRVLVTGAGGSIGSEIVRQVLSFEPAKLILLDRDETHLHDVLTELRTSAGLLESVLGDVRDRAGMFQILMRLRPDLVFHAAAHKHVPVLETHPEEALANNVIGTANIADAAVAAGVRRFVLISTDKAIRPSSVMGASKWFGEQIVRSLNGNGTMLCAVRFGNVLGSRGSVIPTFLKQISLGGPVTVTDPDMTRYLMSVQEAVQLVLQAGAMSKGGEVFRLDMGRPVNILQLARKLIRLSGRVPDRDIEITLIGARPGEKQHEDIDDGDEELMPSGHPSIVVSRPIVPDRAALRRAIRELEILADENRPEDLAERIRTIACGASLRQLSRIERIA
jgi:FlaA1/EpsC-like NDP-sugar epimerase